MAQVKVDINGRNYLIACDDGQEDHLRQLADYVNKRVGELTETVGQVGEARLLVMASLLIADEFVEAFNQVEQHKRAQKGRANGVDEKEAALAASIEALAQRIEHVADSL